jgi:hypothetical protein
MISSKILAWVTFLYFASFTGYLIGIVRGRDGWGKAASWTSPTKCPGRERPSA